MDHLTRDFRKMSLEKLQWPVESKVLTILSIMRLLTMKEDRNLHERAWHTLHPKKAESMTTLKFQDSRSETPLGMDSAVRTTRSTSSTPKDIVNNKTSRNQTPDNQSVRKV